MKLRKLAELYSLCGTVLIAPLNYFLQGSWKVTAPLLILQVAAFVYWLWPRSIDKGSETQ